MCPNKKFILVGGQEEIEKFLEQHLNYQESTQGDTEEDEYGQFLFIHHVKHTLVSLPLNICTNLVFFAPE